MAAVALFSRLKSWRWLQQYRYLCSQAPTQHLKQSPSDEGPLAAAESRIPMIPKTRDPDAVLKALASTVQPVEMEMIEGMGAADPLYPLNKSLKMDYLNHREAGRKAASYVLNRWPKMFTTKKLDLDPGVQIQTPLDFYLARHKAGKCMRAYNKMKEKGEHVSLDTKNELLALVAFFGLRSPYIPANRMHVIYTQCKDISWWTGKTRQLQHAREKVEELEKTFKLEEENEEVESEEEGDLKMTRIEGGVRIWSVENVAEKLFREDFIEEKNVGTYEAMIQGLLKYMNLRRAFELFDEMRSHGYQARTCTYNLLLLSLTKCLEREKVWPKAMYLLDHMTSELKVSPNTETFNALLEVAAKDASATSLYLQIMREMRHVGVEPTLTTLWILLNSFKTKDNGRSVIADIVSILEKNPGIIRLQDTHCYKFFTVAIKACIGHGSTETAMRLYGLAEKHADSGLIDNMNFFVSGYVLALCRDDQPIELIMTEYKRLVPQKFSPYEWVYAELFLACAKHKHLDFLEHLFEDIQKRNVRIDNWKTLNCFCKAINNSTVENEDAGKYMIMLEKMIRWLMDNEEFPSKIPINTLIKLAHQSRDIDKMWNYYALFEVVNEKPTFPALSTILRAYYKSTDKEKLLWIMETMISHEMTLPRNFVKDMCAGSNIDPETSNSIVSRLSHKYGERVGGKEKERQEKEEMN